MNKRNIFCQKLRGLSIVEIVVIVGLVSLLSMILMDIFLVHGNIFNLALTGSDLELQSIRVTHSIGVNLRVANQVVATKTINSQEYTTSSDTLILELPSIDSGGKVIEGSYDYVVFYLDPLDNTKFLFSLEADPSSSRGSLQKKLSGLVNQLKFIYDDSNYNNVESVLIELTLSKSVLLRTQSFNLSTKFNLGNK